MLVRTPQGLVKAAGERDFFTQFIESDREFRVQVYRSAHLGTYEKVLKRPWELKRGSIGRNHRRGYGFELVKGELVPRAAVDEAIKAVRALGLDFGAVDIIHGMDGHHYVLEVNTAPGGEGGRQWLQGLVAHIVNWEKKGYPGRKREQQG